MSRSGGDFGPLERLPAGPARRRDVALPTGRGGPGRLLAYDKKAVVLRQASAESSGRKAGRSGSWTKPCSAPG